MVNWSRNKETEWTYKEAMNILKKSGFSEISTEPYNILTKKIGTENDLKVADIKVATNRYIVDPNEVNFEDIFE